MNVLFQITCISWAPMKFFSLCGIKIKIFFHTKKGRHDFKEQNSHLYWRHLLCDKCVSTVMFSQQVLLNSVWLVCQICCYCMLNDNPGGLLAFKKIRFWCVIGIVYHTSTWVCFIHCIERFNLFLYLFSFASKDFRK